MKDPNRNRPGYKETKVGWIPEEWMCQELQNVVNPKRPICYGVVQAGDHQPDGIACVRVTDLVEGKLDPKIMLKTTSVINNQYSRTILEEGDIMVALRGEAGKAVCVPKVLAGSNLTRGVALISKSGALNGKYLAYAMAAPATKLIFAKSVNGTALQEISIGTLKEIPIILPSYPEQQKIAEILSSSDGAIDRTRELIAAKKRQKKGLMQQLLTGKKRLPGFNDCWDTYRLGDLFRERNETDSGHLPLLAITGSRGVVRASDLVRRDSSSEDKSRYKVIKVGDIGYNTMRMWQGVSAVSRFEGIISPAYTVCIPNKAVDVDFMGYFFKFHPTIYLFWRYSQGLVDDTLSLKYPNFSIITVKVPPVREQQAIAEVLATADAEIALLEQKQASLQQQKKGLMQKLLTGQIRVKP